MSWRDRIDRLVAAADGRREASAEELRGMLAESLDMLAQAEERDIGHLHLLIRERNQLQNDNINDAARHTIRVLKDDLAGLHVGRRR